jgi:hypothetical protein
MADEAARALVAELLQTEFNKSQPILQLNKHSSVDSSPPDFKMKKDSSVQKLDMLNLHVQGLRDPKYREVTKSTHGSVKQEMNFRVSYLPNGKQVELKNFNDVKNITQ